MVTELEPAHAVQVYETDGFLSQRVVEYLAAGLAAGDSCIVIATAVHRDAFRSGLAERGYDVAAATNRGQLVMLDARETLEQFMMAEAPDRDLFEHVIGGALSSLAKPGRRIRAFGEMVDLLWQDGRPQAALRLEELWSGLARQHDFDLLCAYTLANFYKTTTSQFREVCSLHDHMHGMEESANEESEHEYVRLFAAEIARRSEVERDLRVAIRALQKAQETERARGVRIAALQQATAELATAVTLGEVADTIVSATARLAVAGSTAVYLADAEHRFRLFGTHNVRDADDRWSLLPLDAPRPVAQAISTGRSLWIESRDKLVADFPDLGEALATTQSVAALPLVQGGRVIGGIGLSFETRRTFSDEEKRWLESFATQCTIAIERARLYGAEQKARHDAETLLRIAESLNDMHLDLDAILQRVSDEASALIGAHYGAVFYDVNNERGAYVIYATTGASKEALAKFGMARSAPLFAFAGTSLVRADDACNDPRFAGMPWCEPSPTKHLPIASFLAVPVKSRTGEVIGGMFFGHPERAKFSTQHEQLLRALSITAAIAIDNAELYRSSRQAEDAQRATVDQLSDTIRMNELFTGVLAHDLRSPLAAITTASEVLQLKTTGSEKRMAERSYLSARRMARMIEQLLDFTRIRLGTGLPLDTRDVDLAPLVTHVVDEVRVAYPAQPIRLTEAGSTHGRWDDDRLAQALSNLVGNAAMHGRPERGVDVHVDGTDSSVVRVSIYNTGTIPEEIRDRVFEPLTGGRRRHDGSRGLGLGLYITREIAESHGGSVSMSSTNDGTTFTLTLPREVSSTDVKRTEAPAPRAPELVQDTEQRMRTLVEGVRDAAIFMTDARGNVLTWTRTAEHITGWDRAAIIDRSIGELYPRETSLLDVELGRAAKLGSSEHEGWYYRRDGSAFWGHVALSAIRSPSGDLVGYAAIVRDRTEHQETLHALEERELLARLMMDCVRDYAIFMLDNNGNVRTWSRGAQLLKGYTPGEIVGKHISTFYMREDREAGRPQQLLGKALADGRVEDEGWRVRADGSRFWADVVITALRDEKNEHRGFVKVTRDLTERRRADEELRRSEERFRLLVDSVKDYAIFLLDATGHVMTWNTGAERAKGYKAHEIIGQHFSKFYEAEEIRAGKCERELEIAQREGRFEEEGWRLRKDGTRFWANVIITPMRGTDGVILGFAKVTRDLTDRKRLEEERLLTVQAQEGIRLRDEFLSIVSHELKTPLAGLLLQIESAAKNVEDKTRDKLLRARESGERLDTLIETLLDVSRIATGRFVLSTEPCDLSALVKEIADSFQMAAAKAGSEIRLHVQEKVRGVWDRVRMSQVIANLLSNAIKYGAGRPVDVHLTEGEGHATLEIVDHGPGVDPTMQSRIFERFERAASTRHYGGLGIGLYVVREIVVAHGGQVGVENSPEGGARFMIRVPSMEQK